MPKPTVQAGGPLQLNTRVSVCPTCPTPERGQMSRGPLRSWVWRKSLHTMPRKSKALSGSSFSTLPHRPRGWHSHGTRLGTGFASRFGHDRLRKGGNMSSALCQWSPFGRKKSSSMKAQLWVVGRSFQSHLSPPTSASWDEVRVYPLAKYSF